MDRKILIDLLDDFAFGSHNSEQTADRITELYKQDQALQLQQTGVSGCKTIRNCRECNAEVSCDKDFCDKKCQTAYYR